MQFAKFHGLGNDFILLDHSDPAEPSVAMTGQLAALLANRRWGVGCDQIVELQPAAPQPPAHASLRIYNADGSQAEMCGNAVRCVASYLRRHRGLQDATIRLQTLAGLIAIESAGTERWAVDMGPPRFEGREIPTIWSGRVYDQPLWLDGREYRITALSMGNPHCVLLTDQETEIVLEQVGPRLSEHEAFPQRINVELVQVIDRHNIRVRVWERGAGLTPACGTGACAATVAAVWHGLTERQVSVHLDGGTLEILWRDDDRVIMTGPATEVFMGQMAIPTLPLDGV
ncbi:MAG: diaminopimelate epimerase [Magnetococcales bacterium]|nr:diaminopimelate epimerase [Magnetococcales bacterium]